jgi:putative membrane protein
MSTSPEPRRLALRWPRLAALGALLAFAGEALAHDGEHAADVPRNAQEIWSHWGLDPWVLACVALLGLLYVKGLVAAWSAAGAGRGIRWREAACFAGGYLALLVAQISPLHPLSRALFSAHMTQHELLMLVASPLIVLGRPLVAFLHALPRSAARAAVAATRSRAWSRCWSLLMRPGIAWLLHAAILWTWHLPQLFQAALANEGVHALQHLGFVGSASLFWWADMNARPRSSRYGLAVLFMFTTALHTGLLGALLAFTRHVLYPAYIEPGRAFGVDALDDQQLGGLIMWVPACSIYIVAGVALMLGWMRASERGVASWEAGLAPLPGPATQRASS